MCESVQRSATRLGVGGAPTRPNSAAPAACSDETIDNLLAEAKRDLRHMKKRSHVRRLTGWVVGHVTLCYRLRHCFVKRLPLHDWSGLGNRAMVRVRFYCGYV